MANEGSTKPTYSELERVAQAHLDEAGVGKADTLGERVLFLVNWRNSLRYSAEAISKDRDRLRASLARVRGLLQRHGQHLSDCNRLHGWGDKSCDCGLAIGLRAERDSAAMNTSEEWAQRSQKMIDSAAQWSEERLKEVCICGDIRGHHAFGSAFATRNPECNKFQKREG